MFFNGHPIVVGFLVLFGFLIIAVFGLCYFYSDKHGKSYKTKIKPSSCPNPKPSPKPPVSNDAQKMYLGMQELECRFVAYILNDLMSDMNVPFSIRDKVWMDYPQEFSKPVIDLRKIAENAGIPRDKYYDILADMFRRYQLKVDLANDIIFFEELFMKRAKESAPRILDKYLKVN